MATKRTLKKAETMAAKAAAKETPVKSVAAAPVEEAVKAETSKAEITKEAVAEEPAKETAKPAAKKTTAAKRTTVRKTAAPANVDVYVQFLGNEYVAKDVVANIKNVWAEETGKKENDIKDMKVYIKPEENKAYYVINGDENGAVEL